MINDSINIFYFVLTEILLLEIVCSHALVQTEWLRSETSAWRGTFTGVYAEQSTHDDPQ